MMKKLLQKLWRFLNSPSGVYYVVRVKDKGGDNEQND